MHKRFVAHMIARIVLFCSLVMTVPLAWAIKDDYHHPEVVAFVVTILFGSALSGLFLWRYPVEKEDYRRVTAKDGLAIVGLAWVILSALGALPFYLSGAVSHYTDGFFEVVSGFTTTGATIFADIEALPRGLLFWRSLTHWLGGMGIIVLYIALLPALGTHASQLYKAEAPGLTVERVEPRIKETAKNLWSVYFLLSFLEVLALMACQMPLFEALCHTFGTMATGGFSTRNASIGAFGPAVQWVIFIFMVLAGMNFIVHYQVLKGRWQKAFRNEELWVYLALVIGLTGVFALVLSVSSSLAGPLRHAAFQVASILTTTGYSTTDFETWPAALTCWLVLLMFIGGCGGSTGGGMKVVRFLLAIKIAWRAVVQAVFPNAVLPVQLNGKAMEDKLILSVLTYFLIFMLLFLIGTLMLSIIEGCDLVTALTASISALSNIGPGLGRVGPTDNFAWFSLPGKWVLIFLMLAGRLELYSILVLFIPETWKK